MWSVMIFVQNVMKSQLIGLKAYNDADTQIEMSVS
jgi:hypothetical protein